MGLKCLNDCKGNITDGRRRLWEDEEYTCPKCGEQYVIGVTDDYEDDALAYLMFKDPTKRAAEAKEEA